MLQTKEASRGRRARICRRTAACGGVAKSVRNPGQLALPLSNMSARVHGNKSNRASVPKAKGQAEDQKTVFKSVLSNPYDVKW
jgi:hypothetical protein